MMVIVPVLSSRSVRLGSTKLAISPVGIYQEVIHKLMLNKDALLNRQVPSQDDEALWVHDKTLKPIIGVAALAPSAALQRHKTRLTS